MSRSFFIFAFFALLAIAFVSASAVDTESVDTSLVETDSGRASSRFAHLAELLAELEARESAGTEVDADAETETEAESELESWESIWSPPAGKAGKGKVGKAAGKAGKAAGKAAGKKLGKLAAKAKAAGKAAGKKVAGGKKGKKGPRTGTSVKTCRNRAYVRYLHTLRLLVRSQVLQKARRHGGKTCPKNDAAVSALVDKSVASIPTNPLGVVALRMLAQDLRLCNAGKLLSRAFKSVGLKKFPTWRPYGKKGKNAGKKGGKGKGGKGKKAGGKAGKKVAAKGKAAGKGKAGKAGKAAGKGKAGKAGKKFYMFNEMSSEVFAHTEVDAEMEAEVDAEAEVERASWPWGTANKRGEKHTVDAIWKAFTSKLAKNAHDASKRAAGLEAICKKGKAGKGARHAIDPILNTRLDPLKVQLAKNFEAVKGKNSKNPHHARDLASLL